jgi:hypothetical protein
MVAKMREKDLFIYTYKCRYTRLKIILWGVKKIIKLFAVIYIFFPVLPIAIGSKNGTRLGPFTV